MRLVDQVRRLKGRADTENAAAGILPCDRCACGGDSMVINTRTKDVAVFRRRICKVCGARWSTGEVRIADRRASVEAGVVDALVICKIEELLNRMKGAANAKGHRT